MTRRLLLLNGLAALTVAIHHSSGYAFDAMFTWTDRYLSPAAPAYDPVGSLTYYLLIFLQQLDYFALPAFVFVSGFFVAFSAGGPKSAPRWGMVKTRIVNLLLPLLVWTVLFFVVFLRRLPDTFDEVVDRYYFIPLLMQFYLLSSLIIPLARKWPRLLLLAAGLLELGRFSLRYLDRLGVDFVGQDLLIALTPRWLFPMLFFWFALGLVVGLHRQPVKQSLARYKWALLAALPVFLLLTLVEYRAFARSTGQEWLGSYFGGFARQFYALVFILTFLAFEEVSIPFSNHLSYLGGKSLGIYLAHNRLMWLAAVFMYNLTPGILGHQLVYQLILIVVALGGSLLLMEVVSRSPARKVYRYVFG